MYSESDCGHKAINDAHERACNLHHTVYYELPPVTPHPTHFLQWLPIFFPVLVTGLTKTLPES
jgi:hypothetical protein